MATYSLKNLRPYLKKVKADANRAYRAVLLDLLSRIVKATPVDTGAARARWNLALDEPDESTENPANRNRTVTATEIPESAWPRNAFITNNLPYIEALEYGHSKQAPNGMVRRAVGQWQQKIDKAVNDTRR